jgi:hypothetical protein
VTPYWKAITFVAAWSVVWVSIPGYFATRAIRTGRIYDGAQTSDEEWLYRDRHPVRFWHKVAVYYALALIGLVPWVLILVIGIKE